MSVPRLPFVCPACRRTVMAPATLDGVEQSCPKCRELVVWSAPELEPIPDEDEGDGAGPPRKRRKGVPDLPPALDLACRAAAATALVTILLPCVWLLSVPIAVAGAVACVYAIQNYRTGTPIHIAVGVCVFVVIAGLSRAGEVNDALRQIGN